MRFYSPAVRALAAKAASQACAAVAASRAEQFSAASPIERVGLLLGGFGEAEQFSAVKPAPGQRGLFDESDHPRADDGKFATKSGGGGGGGGGRKPAMKAVGVYDVGKDGSLKSVKPGLKRAESKGKVSSDDTKKPSGAAAMKPGKKVTEVGVYDVGKDGSLKSVKAKAKAPVERKGDAYRHGDSDASNGELFQHAGVQKVLDLLDRTDEVESLLSSDDPEDHKKAGKLLLAARHVAIDEDARTYSHLKSVPARKRAAGKLNPN